MRKAVNNTIQFESIGIGMIGYAFMGRIHSNAYQKLRYTFTDTPLFPELIAVAGRNEKKVSSFAAQYGYKSYYTDWHELINDPDVEIVDNCSADPNHFIPTMKTLKAGKHLVIEKPLGMDSGECEQMAAVAALSGSKSMVCFNYRFIPAVRLAKEIISEGRLGTIYNFRGCYDQSTGYDPKKPVEKVWYCRPDRVGIMQGIGSHIIDLGRFLVDEITAVSGLTRTFNKERVKAAGGKIRVKKDEFNIGLVEFNNGAVGSI